jgi:hypothetical protein
MSSRALLTANLVLLLGLGLLGLSGLGGGSKSERQLLQRLAAIEERMIEQQEAVLAELEGCTPARYRLNQCAPGEAPLELNVTVCSEVGAEAVIEGKFGIEAKMSGGVGVGWKDGPDVDVKLEAAMPLVIPPVPGLPLPPLVAPTEVAVGGSGKGGVGIEGCIEGMRAPISAFLTRAQILQILDQMDAGAQQLAVAMAEVTGAIGGISAAADLGGTLDTSRLAGAVRAARGFASGEFSGQDPLAVFSSQQVAALRGSLPNGGFVGRLLDDPSAALPRVDPLNPRICDTIANAPSIAGRLDPICSVTDQLPQLGELMGTLDQVRTIGQQVDDLPDVIRYVVEEALPELPTPQPVLPPSSPFCSRFPRLCFFQ